MEWAIGKTRGEEATKEELYRTLNDARLFPDTVLVRIEYSRNVYFKAASDRPRLYRIVPGGRKTSEPFPELESHIPLPHHSYFLFALPAGRIVARRKMCVYLEST